jgi:NADPH:quinone reductase-like Zn-dependent oxidoreductase
MHDMRTTTTNTPSTTTMTALVQTRFGDPTEVLQVGDVPRPALPDDGVLVRVRAASVAVGTVYTVRGYPRVMRPMFTKFVGDNGVLGQHLAGTVEAVGRHVTDVGVGDEVLGWGSGAYAEYAVATAETLVRKPADLTFEQAAALGVSAFTALQALRDRGDLQAGQHVLVTGASGGVGTFAVQLAKAMGAEVTGVCSTRNLDLVRSIGADHVIDYTREDWTDGEPRYDLVLDNVGGHTLREMRRVLTDDGLLLANGGPAPTGWFGGIGRVLMIAMAALVAHRQAGPFVSAPTRADLDVLRDMAAAGRITPVVDRVFPLQDAVDAVAAVGAGHNRGTTVIAV